MLTSFDNAKLSNIIKRDGTIINNIHSTHNKTLNNLFNTNESDSLVKENKTNIHTPITTTNKTLNHLINPNESDSLVDENKTIIHTPITTTNSTFNINKICLDVNSTCILNISNTIFNLGKSSLIPLTEKILKEFIITPYVIKMYYYLILPADIYELANEKNNNNSIINAFLLLIAKYSYPTTEVFVTPTYFYENLNNKNNTNTSWYNYISNQTLKKFVNTIYSDPFASNGNIKIYMFDLILVPVFLRSQSHWTIAVFDVRKKEAIYFDSLGNDSILRLIEIESAFNEICLDNNGRGMKFTKKNDNSNLQTGGVDCGVYVCLNGLISCMSIDNTLVRFDIPMFRNYIATLLIEKGIRVDYSPD